MNLIKILLLQVLMLLFTPPAYARRVAECGVERYKSQISPACGVEFYNIGRSPECGDEVYNVGPDMSCPGSQPEVIERVKGRHSGSCGQIKCSDGRRTVLLSCTEPSPPQPLSVKPLGSIAGPFEMNCIRDAVPAQCEMAQFGVALYKECRAQNHGIQSYNSCARAEFGVAEYHDCAIRKTTDELVEYLGDVEPHVDVYGYNLISSHGDFMKVQSKPALGCFITKYSQDPLYSEIIKDLKFYFSSAYRELFDEKTFHTEYCQSLATSSQIPNIESSECAESSKEGVCFHVNAYRASKQWLRSNAEEVSLLQKDIAARIKARACRDHRDQRFCYPDEDDPRNTPIAEIPSADLRNRLTLAFNAIQRHLQKDQQFQILGR